VRRRRATSRKPAKPQQTIKAKRGTAATRNRRLSASSKDRKVAQQALRRSERELRDLIETMPAMAVAALPDGSPTFVNRRWTEYTGLSAEDTEGSGWKTAIHPEDFERWLNLWRVCLATGQPFEDEARFRRASDGEYRWFWTRGVPLRDEQGNIAGWYGLGMDIQDRKTAEQERERLRQLERQAERELRVTIDTIPAIVVRYQRDGLAEFVNQTWRTYTGLSQPVQGQRRAVVVHADDLPKVQAAWRAHLPTGQPFEMEQRIRRADGEYRWFFVRRVPLRDENGEVIRWYAVAHDIEDQKRAERALQTAQAELAHVTRVTTLGEMSASIAHEINQPLAAILLNAEATLRLLSRDVPDSQEARAAIADVIKDAHRAGEVIRRIRDFSKKAHPQMMQLNINEVVEEAVKLVRHEALQHGVTIRFEFASGLPPVRGDRIQLQQVIVNLAVNGMEAMTSVQDRERVLMVGTQRDQSDRILVAVADAGVGIERENLDRVFGAFHTTKPGGLGMGLAICRSIIEAHGGRLWAEADVPRGAIFRFTVPALATSTSEVIQ
jgi:PAS domain S-box-containing protein